MQEVIIPKNVDLDEECINSEQPIAFVDPSVQKNEEFKMGFAPSSPGLEVLQKERSEQEAARRLKKEQYKYENFKPLKLVAQNDEEAVYIDYSHYQFKKYGCLMRFFDKKLSRGVNRCKIPIIVVCLAWLLYSMYLGLNIPRQVNKVTMLSGSLPIQQAKDIWDNQLGSSGDSIPLTFFFGIKSQLHQLN